MQEVRRTTIPSSQRGRHGSLRSTATRSPRRLPPDPSINEADVSDKPVSVRERPLLTEAELDVAAERNAQRLEALQDVDDQIGRVVDRLSKLGALDDTYIIVTSDNGFLLGQHRIDFGGNAVRALGTCC